MLGRRLALLAILTAAMFLLGLGDRQFAASHEARVAQPAREMAEAGWPWRAQTIEVPHPILVKKSGVLRLASDPQAPPVSVNPWVVPVLDGEMRLQKPPLPYWCAAVIFRVAGTSEAAARFVPALLGALTTFLLFDLALLLYGSRVAWCAALLWLTTFIVPEEYRAAMADPYLAFFTLLAVWAWVKGSGFGVQGSGLMQGPVLLSICPASPRARVPASAQYGVALFYLSVALGALAKGPLIILHVAIPVALFHLCFGRPLSRAWKGHLLGIAIFLAVALPWPLAVLRQVPGATALWRYESLGEVSGENQENVRAWWYYFSQLPLLAAPWVAVWLFSLAYPFLRRRGRNWFPLLWYMLIVLCFTFVGQKKDPYLLPMMPAEALMIAIAAVPLLRLARRTSMRGLPGGIVAIQAAIGVAWAAALPLLFWHERTISAAALVSSALALVLALLAAREMFAARATRWLFGEAVAYAAVLLVFSHFYLTPLNNSRSAVALCRELSPLADGTHRAILESKLPEEVAFYLPLHPPQGIAPSHYLVVVDDQKGVRDRQGKNAPEPRPDVDEFADWVPGARTIAVQRLPMHSAPNDARWKVYELTVSRTALVRSTQPRSAPLARDAH